uniref:Uncharacterized protein n=1 Tax=Ulva intestinalis TaxID=3116 RepID=A0A8K1MA05_ULVIN|nr:hypothetical protein LK039_mgp40 [Ulva intestinalis]UBR43421.1 hypothetical protein [Ulva intestinalis]
MNYKQSPLNYFSSIKKQKFKSIGTLEGCKDVSKYYKTIHFSLLGNTLEDTVQNQSKATYTRPLRIIVLKFNTPESRKRPYSIDVSNVFNKSPKSVILKHSKTIKISKRFAHWVEPYGTLKQQYMGRGFGDIDQIVGSDISIHEHELYIDCKFQNIVLTKAHISYIVAQTLCNAQYINGADQLSYTERSGVIGALILKNTHLSNGFRTVIYYISDDELKQCALANFAKKQIIQLTQWSSNVESPNQTKIKFEHLLGNTLTGSEQVRTSLHPDLASSNLVGHLQTVVSIGVLNSLKSPVHKLIVLLTYCQNNTACFEVS